MDICYKIILFTLIIIDCELFFNSRNEKNELFIIKKLWFWSNITHLIMILILSFL